METFFLSVILLFIVIFAAVRLAISPLIPKKTELQLSDDNLVQLRNIEVITNAEIEAAKELLNINADRQQFEKFSKALNDLKEIGLFTSDEYIKRIGKLRNHFHY